MPSTIRGPVKTFENTCAWGADKVAAGVDGMSKNTVVATVTKTLSSFESEVVSKTNPLLNKIPSSATNVVRPVIPYVQKGEKTVGRSGLIAAALSVPIIFAIACVALFTSPVWMFFAFITSIFWVPIALVVIPAFVCFAVAIYASKPTGRMQVVKMWEKIKSTGVGQKIFYASV